MARKYPDQLAFPELSTEPDIPACLKQSLQLLAEGLRPFVADQIRNVERLERERPGKRKKTDAIEAYCPGCQRGFVGREAIKSPSLARCRCFFCHTMLEPMPPNTHQLGSYPPGTVPVDLNW
jgi:hypothetical protein